MREFGYCGDFLLFVLSEEITMITFIQSHVYHDHLPRLVVPRIELSRVSVILGHLHLLCW